MFTPIFFGFVKRLLDKSTPWLWLEHAQKFEKDIASLLIDMRWSETDTSPANVCLVAPDGHQAHALSQSTGKNVINSHRLNHKQIAKNDIRLIIVLNANTMKNGTAAALMKLRVPLLLLSNREDGTEENTFLAHETPDNMKGDLPELSSDIPEGSARIEFCGTDQISINLHNAAFVQSCMKQIGADPQNIRRLTHQTKNGGLRFQLIQH